MRVFFFCAHNVLGLQVQECSNFCMAFYGTLCGRLPMPQRNPQTWLLPVCGPYYHGLFDDSKTWLEQKRLLSNEDFDVWKTGSLLEKNLDIRINGNANTIYIKDRLSTGFEIRIPGEIWDPIFSNKLILLSSTSQCLNRLHDESIHAYLSNSYFPKHCKEGTKDSIFQNIERNSLDCYPHESIQFISIASKYHSLCHDKEEGICSSTNKKKRKFFSSSPSLPLEKKRKKRKKCSSSYSSSFSFDFDSIYLNDEVSMNEIRLAPLRSAQLKKLRNVAYVQFLGLPQDIGNLIENYLDLDKDEDLEFNCLDLKNHHCLLYVRFNIDTGEVRIDCRYHLSMYLEIPSLYKWIPRPILTKKDF